MKDKSKGNLAKIKRLISSYSGEEAKIIAVPSELIHFVGRTQQGVFLSQLVYWSDKATRPDKFIYKKREGWFEETGLSAAQIESFTKEFEEIGILETMVKKANGSPTTHYKLNIQKLLESFGDFLAFRFPEKCEFQLAKSEESLTESKTENTARERGSTPSVIDISNADFDNENQVVPDSFDNDVIQGEVVFENDSGVLGANNTPTLLPDNFAVTSELREWAAENISKNIDVELATKKFVVHFEGQRRTNWNKEWKQWMLREREIRHTETAAEERIRKLRDHSHGLFEGIVD